MRQAWVLLPALGLGGRGAGRGASHRIRRGGPGGRASAQAGDSTFMARRSVGQARKESLQVTQNETQAFIPAPSVGARQGCGGWEPERGLS